MEFNEKLFRQFDLNEDGKVTAEELVLIFQNLGQNKSEDEAKEMIKNIKGNEKDHITFEQFNKVSDDVETTFGLFDTDGNGQISPAEFIHRLGELNIRTSGSQVEEIIRRADVDGNGKINIEEFNAVMQCEENIRPRTRKFTMMRGSKPAGISDLWKSVNHVALVVSDIARSAAFYGGSLGMKQVMRPDFDREGAWFTLGNIDLHLIQGKPAVHPDDDLIVSHIALNCGEDDDVQKMMKRLTELGIPYRENISVPNPATKKQVKQAFVRDPDGYYLELCSCDSLEEFLQEKMDLDMSLWNFKRIKTAMTARSRFVDWLNLDQGEICNAHLNKLGKAKAIKNYGATFCKTISESEIAYIASKFSSTSAVLSIIKEKENSLLFENCIKNSNTENFILLSSASMGKLDTLKNAFQEGMDMNFVDNRDRTCLHLACANGNLDCVSFLVKECMANSTMKDFRGLTPFECAKENNHKEVMAFLQEHMEYCVDKMELNQTELEETKSEVLDWIEKSERRILVDDVKLANLVARQKTYGDSLQNVTKDELEFLLRTFGNHVPDVLSAIREKIMAKRSKMFIPPAFYERDKTLFQPPSFHMKIDNHGEETTNIADVMFAAKCGDLSSLRSAYESGVDLNCADYDKKTALHQTCSASQIDCFKFLVEDAKVALEPRDRWGMTPLDCAKEAGNVKLIELLMDKMRIVDQKIEAAKERA